MPVGGLVSFLLAIVSLAGLTVLLQSPNTSNIVSAFGSVFQGSLGTAMGHV